MYPEVHADAPVPDQETSDMLDALLQGIPLPSGFLNCAMPSPRQRSFKAQGCSFAPSSGQRLCRAPTTLFIAEICAKVILLVPLRHWSDFFKLKKLAIQVVAELFLKAEALVEEDIENIVVSLLCRHLLLDLYRECYPDAHTCSEIAYIPGSEPGTWRVSKCIFKLSPKPHQFT
jgi:hypothetical protein